MTQQAVQGPKCVVLREKDKHCHTVQWVNDHIFMREPPAPSDTKPAPAATRGRRERLESLAGQRLGCDESLVGRCLKITCHHNEDHIGLVQARAPLLSPPPSIPSCSRLPHSPTLARG